MKKFYLAVAIAGMFTSFASAQQTKKLRTDVTFSTENVKVTPATNATPKAGVEIWSNNFDNIGDWIIDNGSVTGATYGWDIGSTSESWHPSFDGINSASGGNYAEVKNGDPTATPGTQEVGVAYTLTLSAPIDVPNLAGNTAGGNVTLQFQEYGARFYDNQEVQVSTDGSTWTTVRNNSAYSQLTSTGGSAYPNPATVNINIASAIAANPGTVWIRFSWTSEYPNDTNPNAWVTYGWFIDDVKLFTNPDNDLEMISAWISGEDNEGVEYGRTPQDMASSWTVGAQVWNNGINTQNNLVLDADFATTNGTPFSVQANGTAPLNSPDTVIIETVHSSALTPGKYTGTYTIQSDEEQTGSADFANNTYTREFEITDASTVPYTQYSIDGIGVYSNPDVTGLGTASFGAGSHDGLICVSRYDINGSMEVSGIRVMLESSTVAGGEIFGHIMDTALFMQDNMTPIHNTDGITVTQANISAGYVDLTFPSAVTLSNNAFYAAVTLISNADANPIYISDDETVAQPAWASAIYVPSGTQPGRFSNGTALGIRLMTGNFVSVDENTLAGVSVYPNPSEGVLNITNENGVTNTITVHDLSGKLILTTEASTTTKIDLSANGTGVYLVEVANENGSLVERVVVK